MRRWTEPRRQEKKRSVGPCLLEVVEVVEAYDHSTATPTPNAQVPREDGRKWTAADTLKNVVLALTSPEGKRSLVVVGVPGDRDVDAGSRKGSGEQRGANRSKTGILG